MDLQPLRELRRSGRLIPFIGAGLSMRFGLPSWNQLMRMVAEKLEWDADVFLDSGNPMQLAQYFVSVHNGNIGPLRSLMDRAFAVDDTRLRASRAHRALTQLDLPFIYTTNYDDAIERAFRLHGKPCSVIANLDDIADARPGTEVVKFHGTFSDDQSLVLTESSYFERMDFEGALDIKLRADLLGRSLLFLGSSFSDLNMRFLLYKLHKLRKQGRRQALPTAYLVTFTSSEVQRTILRDWSVETIELDPADPNAAVDEFLEAL
jgi:hypothetical protein